MLAFTVATVLMGAGRPAPDLPAEAAAPELPALASSSKLPVSKTPSGPGLLLEKPRLSGAPSLEEVFAAEGVDRNLRMTLFIQTATSAELAEAIARADGEETWHPALTDQIWLRWAEIDPAAAIASKSNRGQAWWAWAKVDPPAALAAAAGKPELLVKVIRSIGDDDPAQARRLIADHPEADQPGVWDGVLESMAKLDPAGAATLAMERNANLQSVLKDWTSRQPEAARAWIQALPDGPAKRGALETYTRERCRMDPAAGLPEALKLPPGRGHDAIATATIIDLARADSKAARAAAEALPPGEGRQQALGALADQLFPQDPAQALEVLAQVSWGQSVSPLNQRWEYSQDGNRGVGFSADQLIETPALSAKGALQKLVEQDAPHTIRTLAALPAEREAPLADAVWQWSAKEPEATSAWLRDQPAGEARDRGIDGLVRRLVEKEHADYEAALLWAASATPATRDKLLRKALNGYSIADQQAAAAAAEKLGIQPKNDPFSFRY